jgi:uncharacterized damage-inducible protein DinB
MTARELRLARMAATAGLLREMTADLDGETASRAPASGEWSIAEVVRHLVQGDRDTFLPRLRRMLGESRPVFDKTTVAPGDATDLPTLVAAFASARTQVVKTLRGLDDAGWRREGVSPSRGALSVETYAATMDAHDTEHLRQIQDARAALGLRPKRCEARAPLTVADIVAALETAAPRLAAVAADLGETQRRRRPAAGAWCLNEVMGHLLHVETEVFLPRLRRIVAEDQPAFEAFSPEPWTHERDHSLDAFDGSLAAFTKVRDETLALLRALPPGAAERLGLSAFFGPVTLGQYATHIADHDLEHLAQMRECRRAAGA